MKVKVWKITKSIGDSKSMFIVANSFDEALAKAREFDEGFSGGFIFNEWDM